MDPYSDEDDSSDSSGVLSQLIETAGMVGSTAIAANSNSSFRTVAIAQPTNSLLPTGSSSSMLILLVIAVIAVIVIVKVA